MPVIAQLLGRRVLSLGLMAALILGVGCGSGVGKLLPVSGKVTVNGQPLKAGSVLFKPDSSKGNTSKFEPAGTIEGGSYTLFTKGKPGAAPGWYKVSVVAQEEIDSTNPNAPKSLVNPAFSDPEKSGISVEVVADPKQGAYDLNLS